MFEIIIDSTNDGKTKLEVISKGKKNEATN